MGNTGYELIRSNRKTIALQISRDSRVIVRCPTNMKDTEIEKFVERHRDWIAKHLTRMSEMAPERRDFSFEDGQEVLFMGERYPIRTEPRRTAARFSGDSFFLPAGDETVREKALTDCLLTKADELLTPLLKKWAGTMGLTLKKHSIGEAKSRWGSCSAKGTISISWRTVMLPPDLMDYIVVHELAHLSHLNHSPEFHALVREYLETETSMRFRLRSFTPTF